jgi:hypothetical protein
LKFDYCTIIGRNPKIFLRHIDNVLRNAGISRDLWSFHTIVYTNSKVKPETTREILDICRVHNIIPHLFREREGSDFEIFLANLYDCWNLCQTVGDTPLNIRAGSDQAFSQGAFEKLIAAYEKHGKDDILFQNLVECKENAHGSRHILQSFGTSWETFDEAAFQAYCKTIEVEGILDFEGCKKNWGFPINQPGLASNDRADGASWIQSKRLFKQFGPMPPRYSNGLTGDIGIMERMRKHGVNFYVVGDSITYHIVKGESAGVTQ